MEESKNHKETSPSSKSGQYITVAYGWRKREHPLHRFDQQASSSSSIPSRGYTTQQENTGASPSVVAADTSASDSVIKETQDQVHRPPTSDTNTFGALSFPAGPTRITMSTGGAGIHTNTGVLISTSNQEHSLTNTAGSSNIKEQEIQANDESPTQNSGTFPPDDIVPHGIDRPLALTYKHTPEIRYICKDLEGNVYTLWGDTEVTQLNLAALCLSDESQQIHQRLVSANLRANAFVVNHTEDYTFVFLGHKNGKLAVWWRDNANEQKPTFHLLQTKQNKLLQTNQVLQTPEIENAITCLCLSDDNQYLYCGSRNRTITTRMLSVSTINHEFKHAVYYIQCHSVDTMRGHLGVVLALAVGPGVLYSGSSGGEIIMWQRVLRGSKVRHDLIRKFDTTPNVPVNALAFWPQPNNNAAGWLYAGSADATVRCWNDHPLMQQPEVMVNHHGGITCLASCPGPFVFSGSDDKNICVLRRDTAAGKHTVEAVLKGHQGSINCIMPLLNTWPIWRKLKERVPWVLFSASKDGTVKIWRNVYEQPEQAAASQ